MAVEIAAVRPDNANLASSRNVQVNNIVFSTVICCSVTTPRALIHYILSTFYGRPIGYAIIFRRCGFFFFFLLLLSFFQRLFLATADCMFTILPYMMCMALV